MHCRYSHVLYHCAAVNRAPLRRWLYKIKRAKSELCRYGCGVVEDINHVCHDCPQVREERCHLRNLCVVNNHPFTVLNILSQPSLQLAAEKLLLAFMCKTD